MDYNEYNGNGNKKKFDLSEILSNKQQRSRLLLLVYLIVFIILVIFVRLNLKTNSNLNNNENSTNQNNEIIEDKPKEDNEKKEVIKLDMFSYIDMDNYDFKYNITVGDSISLIEGKRYDDKYSFTMENNGYILYFNGTKNYIKAKETQDGESQLTGFPYVLINCFDTKIIEDLVNNATVNDNGIYEITNEMVGKTVKYDKLGDKDKINTIELVKRNNIVTDINMDFSNAISSYIGENTSAILALHFSNFGLIDDFIVE